jgi:hypothetical protein
MQHYFVEDIINLSWSVPGGCLQTERSKQRSSESIAAEQNGLCDGGKPTASGDSGNDWRSGQADLNGSSVVAGTSDKRPGPGYHYVGYPMAYWVQFKPEYGFHAGPVWPVPHSHGCIRLHPSAAPKFFALVHRGTLVDIAPSQPEDQTVGKNVNHPPDYKYPDPPGSYMVSSAVFTRPQGPLLQNQ